MRLEANKRIIEEHKKVVIACDVAIVLAILLNAGTAFVTNALVTSSVPEEKRNFEESNPVKSQAQGLEATAPTLVEQLWGAVEPILFNLVLWMVLAALYTFIRMTITSYRGVVKLATVSAGAFVLYFLNFSSDFGFLAGVLL